MAGVMTTQPDVVIRYIVSDIRQHFSILQVFRFPCVVSKPKRKVRMRTNRWIHFWQLDGRLCRFCTRWYTREVLQLCWSSRNVLVR